MPTTPGTGPGPELPPDLQAILEASESTPAGRSFYPTDDLVMRQAAQMLAPQPGYYVVDLHGTADRAKVGSRWLEVDEVADLVRAAPDWHGQDVFLMSCDAGRRDDGFAKQLADRLQVEVAAPDKLAWSDFAVDGPAQPYSSDAVLTASGIPCPVKPPTGTFLTFRPTPAAQADDRSDRTAELGADRTAAPGVASDGARLGLLHQNPTGRTGHRDAPAGSVGTSSVDRGTPTAPARGGAGPGLSGAGPGRGGAGPGLSGAGPGRGGADPRPFADRGPGRSA